MIDINKLVRKNILKLMPYSSARDEFSGEEGIFLDANENPYGDLNRYPDPYQQQLKNRLSELMNVCTSRIFIGNGSDEVIDLAFRIFCEPGKDKALTFTPTYGMYDVSAAINDVELLKVPLDDRFQIDPDRTSAFLDTENLKLIFICSPNNPTGNLIEKEAVENILQQFNGIVIIDEAYIDFSNSESWAKEIEKYPNLIVSQTFSKARGLAAARVGVAYASEEIISWYNKIKPPYNISALNQQAALNALEKPQIFQQNLENILTEKQKLEKDLLKIPVVKKIYPSDANFLLVEVSDAGFIYEELIRRKIIIRNRNKLVANSIRITVGTAQENNELINALNEITR